MDEESVPIVAPRVGAYALIGHDDRLLLISDRGTHKLPGGAVRSGEPVERALRTWVRDQLGATASNVDFCAVIEHGTSDAGVQPASEVAFLFDVTVAHADGFSVSARCPHVWAGQEELSSLTSLPTAVRGRLIHPTLLSGSPWWPWS